MKLVGIGDLFIPQEYIKKGFESFRELGVEVSTVDWQIGSFDELQKINLMVENGGREAYEVPDYIIDAVRDADIIITQFCPISRRVIDCCRKLRVIGALRGGYENVNVAYAGSKDIVVYNTPGRNADAVADFTIGAIICECRNIARGHFGLKNGKWIRGYPNSAHIPDLPGKTVGIIGLGEIGRKVAKRLTGFDMRLLGYDPYVKEPGFGVRMVELDYLMRESDFITIHVRLNEHTKGLVDERKLGLMKPTAYIINTSRAEIIDEQALYMALKNRNIAGAMLDVFGIEPPGADHPLVTLDNVTITPHMAGGSKDAFFNSPSKLAPEIRKLFKNESSGYVVNREVLDRVKASLILIGG